TADVEKARGNKPAAYTDYRKMLDNKDIDAVIIATPDHWHCLTTIAALEAGKNVYVEKPLTNSIEECNIMVKAAIKHNKIVQVGQWQTSGSQYREAIDYLRSGKLGNIRLATTSAYQGGMKSVPALPNAPVPPGV